MKHKNEWDLVQKVLLELESTDEVLFQIGANTISVLPFQGTVTDSQGEHYDLTGSDSSEAFQELVKKHKLTYSILQDAKQIKFSGPSLVTIPVNSVS